MGSLSSRPNVPAQQPVVYYVPTPAPTNSNTSGSTTNNTGTDTPTIPTDDDVQAGARVAGLLERRRGVLSTVLTGFRGVLSQDNKTSQRKTLLGE